MGGSISIGQFTVVLERFSSSVHGGCYRDEIFFPESRSVCKAGWDRCGHATRVCHDRFPNWLELVRSADLVTKVFMVLRAGVSVDQDSRVRGRGPGNPASILVKNLVIQWNDSSLLVSNRCKSQIMCREDPF